MIRDDLIGRGEDVAIPLGGVAMTRRLPLASTWIRVVGQLRRIVAIARPVPYQLGCATVRTMLAWIAASPAKLISTDRIVTNSGRTRSSSAAAPSASIMAIGGWSATR